MTSARKRLAVIGLLAALLMVAPFLLGVLNQLLFALEVESLSFRQRQYSDACHADPHRLSPVESSIHQLIPVQCPPSGHSSPIMLVLLDAKTENSPEFRRHFGIPTSRSAPATLVRFFRRTRPNYVVFDMSFNRPNIESDISGNQDFVDSLQGTNLFASDLIFHSDPSPKPYFTFQGQKPDIRSALADNAIQVKGLENFPLLSVYSMLITPFPELMRKTPMRFYSSSASVTTVAPGAANHSFQLDNSNESRRWAAFAGYGPHVFPTIALGVVLKGEKKLTLSRQGILSWPGGSINLGADGFPLVKWYGHQPDRNQLVYPETSFWDVIVSEMVLECGETPDKPWCREKWLPAYPPMMPEQFKDKYVLIGSTSPYTEDFHRTIYGDRYFGVYILANTLHNILSRDFVYPAPWWQNALAFFMLFSFPILAIRRYRSVLTSLLVVLTVGLLYFLLCMHAYNAWNLWLNSVYPLTGLMLSFSGTYVVRFSQERQQRQQLRSAFGHYVSPDVMTWIEQNPDKVTLGGERREMSFLFCDIRGFTTYSDHHSPEEVQAMLTQYFGVVNGIIQDDYKGTIDKMIGDAVMAYWNFPQETPDHAFQAVSAALAMREAMTLWRQDPDKPPIHIGIGINTGEAMIGNVGSEGRFDLTVIGDAVNVASRLESANKEHGTDIIISAATYALVQDRIRVRPLGETAIRGKVAHMEIFEPLGF